MIIIIITTTKSTDLKNVKRAFGENLATELMETYEGSHLISDSQQDLIGETYLAEQIRLIEEEQKKTSILDRWGHLFYEGEGMYEDANGNTFTKGQRTLSQRSLRSQNVSQADLQAAVAESQRTQSRRSQRSQPHSRPQSQQQQQQQQQDQVLQSDSQSSMNAQLIAQVQANMLAQLEERRRQEEAADDDGDGEGAYTTGAESHASEFEPQEYSDGESRNPNDEYSAQQSGPSYSQSQSQSGQSRLGIDQSNSEGNFQSENVELPHSRLSHVSKVSKKSTASKASKASKTSSKASKVSSKASGGSKSRNPQQPESYLPSLSESTLKQINLDAYNSPEFKAMLDLITKPLEIPPETINYPPEWPVDEKISKNSILNLLIRSLKLI
jgi:hypothetical protein